MESSFSAWCNYCYISVFKKLQAHENHLLTALTEYRCDSCHTLSPERNCGENSPQSSSSYNYAVSTSDCDGEADRLPTHSEKRAKKKWQRTTFSIDAWSMGTRTNIRAAAIIDAWRRRGLGEEDWDHGQESEDELPQEVLTLHWFLVCSSRITVIWRKIRIQLQHLQLSVIEW